MSIDHGTTDAGSDDHDDEGGTVSEGGSGALNSETSQGGADSVPDTPDVNESRDDDAQSANVAGERGDTD